jgi:hypothetical protein
MLTAAKAEDARGITSAPRKTVVVTAQLQVSCEMRICSPFLLRREGAMRKRNAHTSVQRRERLSMNYLGRDILRFGRVGCVMKNIQQKIQLSGNPDNFRVVHRLAREQNMATNQETLRATAE